MRHRVRRLLAEDGTLMSDGTWLVAAPVSAAGIGIGVQYVKRVVSYKRRICHFILEATGAHPYQSRKTAEKAAEAFKGTVVPL